MATSHLSFADTEIPSETFPHGLRRRLSIVFIRYVNRSFTTLECPLTRITDVALPKATVNKFANEIAASLEVRLTADTRELIAECCTEFVQLLSSEANEICEKDKKKTITPEHVLRALQQLGLDRFHADVKEEYEKAKCDDNLKSRGASKRERQKARASADDEELLRQQEQLFAMARSDPMASNHPPE